MQRGIAQPQAIQIARRKAFDEHIPVGEHTQQQVAPRGGSDIERDAALVRVKSEKSELRSGCGTPPRNGGSWRAASPRPGGSFQRRRALIGQQLGTEGAGKTVGQFHNLHVI